MATRLRESVKNIFLIAEDSFTIRVTHKKQVYQPLCKSDEEETVKSYEVYIYFIDEKPIYFDFDSKEELVKELKSFMRILASSVIALERYEEEED